MIPTINLCNLSRLQIALTNFKFQHAVKLCLLLIEIGSKYVLS